MQIVGRCRFSRFPDFEPNQVRQISRWARRIRRPADWAGLPILSVGRSTHPPGSGATQIHPLPDFATAQVQVTARFQRSPALHVTQQILAAKISRLADLLVAQNYPRSRFTPAPDFNPFQISQVSPCSRFHPAPDFTPP